MSKFNETFYVKAYELARSGLTDKQIAEALGVTAHTFRDWVEKKPAFNDAITRGRGTDSPGGKTMGEYIYGKLSPEVQKKLNLLTLCDKVENGVKKAELLLATCTKEVKQRMFLQLWVECSFSQSEALKKLGLSKATLDSWIYNDPDFAKLIDEVKWHKDNYIESAIFKRIEEGDTACILFAAKTQLKDRGYGDQVKVKVEGKVEHEHTVNQVRVSDLGLPLEVAKALLEKIQQKRLEQGPRPVPEIGHLSETSSDSKGKRLFYEGSSETGGGEIPPAGEGEIPNSLGDSLG